MAEERDIQSSAVRCMLGAIEAVAGVKGKNMVLRLADLEQYVENPPPLEADVFMPAAHYRAICKALRDAFGTKGSRPLLIFAGEETIRIGLESAAGAGLYSLAM